MALRVYFYDDASDEQRAVNEAREASVEEIHALMARVLVEPGSFVGVLAPDDSMVTFLAVEGGIHVDFPDAARRGAYVKVTTRDECRAIVAAGTERFDPEAVDGLAFEKW